VQTPLPATVLKTIFILKEDPRQKHLTPCIIRNPNLRNQATRLISALPGSVNRNVEPTRSLLSTVNFPW